MLRRMVLSDCWALNSAMVVKRETFFELLDINLYSWKEDLILIHTGWPKHLAMPQKIPATVVVMTCARCKGYKGYKDGLQPESLADGKSAGETKSTSVEN